MALPQRRDPYEERRELQEIERRRIEEERTGGWWWSWWWIWLLIIFAAIWFAGWGWGGYGGWWWGAPRTTVVAQPAGQLSGPGVAVLNATNKTAYVGQSFQIRDVPVQSKASNQALWIGMNNTSPMLVVLTGAGNTAANANIGQGNRIDVTGTVEKAPTAGNVNKSWGLDNNGVKRLEQEGAYVQATQVQKVGR